MGSARDPGRRAPASGATPPPGAPPSGSRWPLLALALLALIVRLDFAFRYPIAQISDYSGYYARAMAVAGLGQAHPSAWEPVAPRLLYALPLRLSGGDLRALGVTNALVFAAAVLAFVLAAERLFGRPTAVVAALASVCSLSELLFNNLACSEVLATLFVGLLLLAMVAEAHPGRRVRLTGLLLGLSVYNRSNMIGMIAAVPLLELLLWRGGWRALARAAAVQGVAALVLLPLCAYNLARWGRFTPLTSNSGIQLWYGNNPEVSPGRYAYARLPEQLPSGSPEQARLRAAYAAFAPELPKGRVPSDAYALSDLGRRYAVAWIRANPGRYARMVVSRIDQLFGRCTFGIASYLFYDPSRPGQPRWREADRRRLLGEVPVRELDGPPNPRSGFQRFSEALYRSLLAASLVGLALTLGVEVLRRRRAQMLAPLLVLVVYSLPFLLTIALNRYHVPILPLLWLYLGHGLVLLAGALRGALVQAAGLRPLHAR